MGTLFVVAGSLAIFAGLFLANNDAPTIQATLVGTVSIAAGLFMLLLQRPVPDKMIYAYAVGGILALSFLIGSAKTEFGTSIAAMPFLWFSIYFGLYLEPRTTRVLIVLVCLCCGAALVVSDVPISIPLWVVFSATVIITAEALLSTSRALRVLAREDPLTGLLNRRGLQEAIGPVSGMSQRMGRPMSVVAIDLDDFKLINDSQGHAAGDRILVELTSGWVGEKRAADLIARVGGDEFVLVMPATSIEEGKVLVDRLRGISQVEWSCGVVELKENETVMDGLERADRALYHAKDGRDGVAGDAGAESP